MSNDVRKEQLALLRFEKQIAGLAATLAAGAAVAAAADDKLHASAGSEAYNEIQAALLHLAEVTGNAHEALNAQALDIGARIYEAAGGGLPKPDPPAVVASILGIG